MFGTVPDLKEQYRAERDLLDALQGILESPDVFAATEIVRDLVASFGGELLSLKFSDISGERPLVRPYSAYPDIVRQISIAMQPTGGCPFCKESKKRLKPFGPSSVDRKLYGELNDRIFFRELDRLGFGEILVLPVVIGKGIAITTIGLPMATMDSPSDQVIKGAFPHIVAAFVSKFPTVTTLFEERRLSDTERKVVKALSTGKDMHCVCRELQLSAFTVNTLLASSLKKLDANNLVELGVKAENSGELCDCFTG